jgi:hypothetical protein
MLNTTHPRTHIGPQWIWAIHDKALARVELGELLRGVGGKLTQQSSFSVGSNPVHGVPETIELEMKHEITPHGSKAIIIRIEWPDDGPAGAQLTSAHGLVIGDIDASEVTS